MTTNAKRDKLSDQVRKAIEDSGETRSQIAKNAGLDDTTLCRFASGERGLSMTVLDTLAEYLQLRIVSDRKPAKKRK